MASPYPLRYEGTRWTLLFGSREGAERVAVTEIQRVFQAFLPYVLSVRPAVDADAPRDGHLLLVGTPENHPRIAELAAAGRIGVPDTAESYALFCGPSAWDGGGRMLVVAGRDAAGVLHGVHDAAARITLETTPEFPALRRKALDEMADFAVVERPAIENRGIWTWGYVIYDYRRFLDRMAQLRMSMLTIWNDCPPENIEEILAYAHDRAIRVVLGFHWGWGLADVNLADEADRRRVKRMVIDNYRRNYAGLDIDGIYFQTLTEHHQLELGGVSTARAACMLVNDTARALYEENPDLTIQFGIHATSIRERYTELADLDPRVVLVWEDAGSVPFSYNPAPAAPEEARTQWNGTPEATLAYARELARFRPGTEFAMVPKGWIHLRWGSEFEHHGPFILGERDAAWIGARRAERQPLWDRVNAVWMHTYSLAARFYRELRAATPAAMTVTGLVEDGMLEETIQPSVALFGQTLWDPTRPDAEILYRAMSPYYR